MEKAIFLGVGAGLLMLLLDYWTYVKLFPPTLLVKMSTGLRVLVIDGNILIEVAIISLVRRFYLPFQDMQDKSLNDHICWGLMALFFVVPKWILFIKLLKLPRSMWRK
jgi:hypothetical protein